jgi:hypothetical protein
MNTPSTLTGPQQRTYVRIFQDPAAQSLSWKDVLGMFRQLGMVEEEPTGAVKVTRHGHVLTVHPRLSMDVEDREELMAMRRFLETTQAEEGETHLLLVIDHHEARLYRSKLHGSVPEQILPHAPEDYFRHAHHSMDFTRGQEKPNPSSFFGPLARAMASASRILIFGTGTGTSSEMDQFIGWLRVNHPELAGRIIGSVVVNTHHMTEAQLLAMARQFYSGARPRGALFGT